MTRDQKDRMILVKDHLDFIENSISEANHKLDQMMAPHEHLITLLSTIPGMKCSSAITIISEISTDMTPFSSSKRLCSWARLTPVNNESAGKKKTVQITRAGVYLKPALVPCAHAAVKSRDLPYYRLKNASLNGAVKKELLLPSPE